MDKHLLSRSIMVHYMCPDPVLAKGEMPVPLGNILNLSVPWWLHS